MADQEPLNNKACMRGANGAMITQSLFLEFSWSNPKFALFTIADEDKIHNGKKYLSLKALFLEMEDIEGYIFATTYLLGWDHWKRMLGNKRIKAEIDKWREELEIKMRSQAIMSINNFSEDNMRAAQYIAEGGWKKRGAGRPTNAEKTKHLKIEQAIDDELHADVNRMSEWSSH